jgi:copper chaperone CopZ
MQEKKERNIIMKKTYKIDVDCANCAAKMEDAANKVNGVKAASVNFMALKMKVEFEDGVEPNEVMKNVLADCRKVEPDCEIFFE